MRKLVNATLRRLAAVVQCAMAASAWGSAHAQAGGDPHPPAILLAGDSTVATGSGWGDAFCGAHVARPAVCQNFARAGSSSSSFRADGYWQAVLDATRRISKENGRAIWILIQFGHNDQPGKPGRSTDLATEFPANLRRMIDEARIAGGLPVLVTPLGRRIFADGVVRNGLAPWAKAVRQVATDSGAPMVDLNALSVAAMDRMGEAEAMKFAPSRAASASIDSREVAPGGRDLTHLNPAGGAFFANMVALRLVAAVPDLRGIVSAGGVGAASR